MEIFPFDAIEEPRIQLMSGVNHANFGARKNSKNARHKSKLMTGVNI